MAFVHDAVDDDARDRALPPLQGAELALAVDALSEATAVAVDLVPMDLRTDPSGLAEISTDLGYVAAIVAPGVRAGSVRELVEAGLAVMDLSPYGEPAPAGAWRRLVPPLRVLAAALAAHADAAPAARAGVCLLEDPTTAVGLLRHVDRTLRSRVVLSAALSPDEIAGPVARSGCRLLVWDGDAAGAVGAVARLEGAGLDRITVLGGDPLRDAGFLAEAGAAAEGTVSACGCADLSTSTALAAQRFIQDFQSEYGLPPGPYAVEAWDAANLIVRALRAGGPTREGVAARISATGSFDGLTSAYVFGDGGELEEADVAVRLAEARGGRWIPLAAR